MNNYFECFQMHYKGAKLKTRFHWAQIRLKPRTQIKDQCGKHEGFCAKIMQKGLLKTKKIVITRCKTGRNFRSTI